LYGLYYISGCKFHTYTLINIIILSVTISFALSYNILKLNSINEGFLMPDYDDTMNYTPLYTETYPGYANPGTMLGGYPYNYGYDGYPIDYGYGGYPMNFGYGGYPFNYGVSGFQHRSADDSTDYRRRPFGFGGGFPFGFGLCFGAPFGVFPFFLI